MRKYEEEEKTYIVEELKEVICNKCGNSIDFINHEEHVHNSVTFGYFSKHFGDMEEVEFDLCEKCLYDFVNTFKVPCIVKIG